MNLLFYYTSGRWLWNEREQLEARHRRFDMPSLQQSACQALGIETCISFEKISESIYNKAYHLEMDNGQKVIAELLTLMPAREYLLRHPKWLPWSLLGPS